MQEWYSIEELVELFNSKRKTVQTRARRSGWRFREETNPSGGWPIKLYHIDSLPNGWRDQLKTQDNQGRMSREAVPEAGQSTDTTETPAAGETASPQPAESHSILPPTATAAATLQLEQLPEDKLNLALARSQVVAASDRFHQRRRAAGYKKRSANDYEFVDRFNAQRLKLDEEIYGAVESISISTLSRWRKRFKQGGVVALAPRHRGRTRALNSDQAEQLLGLRLKMRHSCHKEIWRTFLDLYGGTVSYSTVKRFLERWEEDQAEVWLYRTAPDKWKGSYLKPPGNQKYNGKYFGQKWEMDSTAADVICVDGKRYAIVALMDVFSGKVIAGVFRTSSSEGIALVMRRALIQWGVPEIIIKDNGKDYASKRIKAICHNLEVEAKFVPPFRPELKPHIERWFGELTRKCFAVTPGFCGANVAVRQEIREVEAFVDHFTKKKWDDKKQCVIEKNPFRISLTLEQLQQRMNEWVEYIYHQQSSKRDGNNGRSPEEMAATGLRPMRRISDLRILDMLLANIATRTVRGSMISYNMGKYEAPELIDYNGKRVQLREDGEDASRVAVFTTDNKFIAYAEDLALKGLTPKEIRERRKEHRRKIRELNRALDVVEQGAPEDPLGERIQKRAAAGRVKSLVQVEEFEAAAVDEAQRAVEFAEEYLEQPRREELEEKPRKAEVIDFTAERLFMSKGSRYEWLLKKKQGGHDLSPKDTAFIERYRLSDEYKQFRILYEPLEEGIQ